MHTLFCERFRSARVLKDPLHAYILIECREGPMPENAFQLVQDPGGDWTQKDRG